MQKYNPETDLCEESVEKALIECFSSKYHQFGLAELLGFGNTSNEIKSIGKALDCISHPTDINAPELESEVSDDSLETFEYETNELDSKSSS